MDIKEVIKNEREAAALADSVRVDRESSDQDAKVYAETRDKHLELANWLEELLKYKELKGKWVQSGTLPDYRGLPVPVWGCSQCGKKYGTNTFNYCPNCGIDMREYK